MLNRYGGSAEPLRAQLPAPPRRPPTPADAALADRCDQLARLVARKGRGYEDLVCTQECGNTKYAFLFGGPGAEYYAWRRAEYQAAAAKR